LAAEKPAVLPARPSGNVAQPSQAMDVQPTALELRDDSVRELVDRFALGNPADRGPPAGAAQAKRQGTASVFDGLSGYELLTGDFDAAEAVAQPPGAAAEPAAAAARRPHESDRLQPPRHSRDEKRRKVFTTAASMLAIVGILAADGAGQAAGEGTARQLTSTSIIGEHIHHEPGDKRLLVGGCWASGGIRQLNAGHPQRFFWNVLVVWLYNQLVPATVRFQRMVVEDMLGWEMHSMQSHVGYALNGGVALLSKPKDGVPSRSGLTSFLLGGVMRVVMCSAIVWLSRHLLIFNLIFFVLMELGLRQAPSDEDAASISWTRAFWIMSAMRWFACVASFELVAVFLGFYTHMQDALLSAQQREDFGDVPLGALCVLLFWWALPGWSVARMHGVERRLLQAFLAWNCKRSDFAKIWPIDVLSSVLSEGRVRRPDHVGVLPLHRRCAARWLRARREQPGPSALLGQRRPGAGRAGLPALRRRIW